MQIGDLVIVKEGCGDEGKVGVILNAGEVVAVVNSRGVAFCDVLFPEGVKHVNGWWLQPLEVADANR